MAARDFMPFVSRMGGHNDVHWAPLNAAESFREGELVYINNDGELAEFPQDGTEALIADMDGGRLCGVAAMDGDTARTDGFAKAAGDRTSYWPADDGTLFITRNYQAVIGTDAIPPGTIVGEPFQVTYDNVSGDAKWVVEATAGVFGTDVVARIHSILNANMTPIGAADTTTGVFVVFDLVTV